MTLPSNVKNETFDNITGHYKTHIPDALELQGKWECALSEITFQKNWKTFEYETKVHFQVLYDLNGVKTMKKSFVTVEAGYYPTPTEYINQMISNIPGNVFDEEVPNYPDARTRPAMLSYDYNKDTGIAELSFLRERPASIQFQPDVAAMLSITAKTFETRTGMQKWRWTPPSVLLNNAKLYIYCDVIEDNVVGDVRAKLLRTVPVNGKNFDYITYIFNRPYYHKLRPGYISDIEIQVCNDLGELVKFQSSKLECVLHFRKIGLDI